MFVRFFGFFLLVFSMQSEDDFSLSGIALTALLFDGKSRLLVSGDESGIVRMPLPLSMVDLEKCSDSTNSVVLLHFI